MKAVIIFLAVFQFTSAWYNHVVTPEDEELNRQIKAEFSEVLAIKAVAGHRDLNETVGDIVGILGDNKVNLTIDQLLTLEKVSGVVLAPNQSHPENTINSLAPLLISKLESAGDLSKMEVIRLEQIAKSLAERYAKKMKEAYAWWDKPIYVVPIGKLKTSDEITFSVLIGVLGERKDGTLCGISALLLRLDHI
ncbi:hypothetical protein DdX_12819 [Ditylenchus destructor]|uniref:Uncharacterized protein n=1 Tax=Ditylenchus destructor TaxID=166010 RepID=A0AAD4MV04_9BILA|nr:hypothetical protein DdX_12819 [Ditylenchus destructor]